MRIVVVLPLPLPPRKPQISPSGTCSVSPSITVTRAEALAQVVHVDGERGHRRTSTGWPGLSCTAWSGGGCASIR